MPTECIHSYPFGPVQFVFPFLIVIEDYQYSTKKYRFDKAFCCFLKWYLLKNDIFQD